MINFKVKTFFNAKAVIDDIEKKERKGLAYFGAVVRLTAKRSIRKVKKYNKRSRPGEPPKSHVGTLRNHIYYSWDPRSRSVVVGPEIFSPASGAPNVLEYGGRSSIYLGRRKKKEVRVQARPFMQPAFEKHRARLPDYIAGTVGRKR